MPGNAPNKSPKSAQEDLLNRRPTVSSQYTRIYPVRSLLPDVQPDLEVASPSISSEQSFHFLSEILESAAAISSQRTAKWTETLPTMADAMRTFPKSRSTPPMQSPMSEDRKTSFFPPFSTSYPHKPSAGEISQPGSLVSLDGEPRPPSNSSPPSSPRPSIQDGTSNETVIQIHDPRQAAPGPPSADSSSSGTVPGLGAGSYVHLPPATSSDSPSTTTRSSLRSLNPPSAASYSDKNSSRAARLPSNSSHPSDADRSGSAGKSGEDDNSSGASVLVKGEGLSQYSTGSSADSSMYHVTHRFKHVETEDGHHLLIGREGKLERCEDEPIRTPGAVQGFGVLIAVEEDYETGNLIVRQVSENCTEILGLTPQFLFHLKCFSHTLPDHQADILWDNIQYLSEPEQDSPFDGTSEESPQIFLLSGWGEPGSIVHDSSTDEGSSADASTSGSGSGTFSSTSTLERRPWTCWVAAHRPKRAVHPPTSADAEVSRNDPNLDINDNPISSNDGPRDAPPLIILEFELENDTYNPIYPIPDPNAASGADSPAQRSEGSSGAASAGNSVGSDKTTMQGTVEAMQADSVESGSPTPMAVTGDTHPPDDETTPTPAATSALGSGSGTPSLLTLGNNTPARNPGLPGAEDWQPSPEDILQSTTSQARPIKALERMRRMERAASYRQNQRSLAQQAGSNALEASSRGRLASAPRAGGGSGRGRGPPGAGTLDVFSVLAQVNEQLSNAPDLPTFLDVVVGVMKDLTQFHRVLVYQFDESLNGQVVAELVDWSQTHDLFKGLHFPAADIPAQARELYKINKVRSLYNRGQVTARLVGRTKADVENPLDLTHSYLRAMSPIHLKYLENMGVRGSMSISIVSFGELWGLICCHSYGEQGMRVSFPVRQMLRLLSDSISRNVERLSYAQRLHTRKLISTIPTEAHPTGYIVSNAEDLLGLFDADYGILVIGEGAKILGPNQHGQDLLITAEYLRLKQYKLMQVSQEVTRDFPDMNLPTGLNVIAGLLYVPLSPSGQDFIAFLRKGQLRDVNWAGRPLKGADGRAFLEPRSSFKAWSETVVGRCRAWTNEELETAGVLALVYGKFIEVWRQKESAVKTTQLTNILLSNASHEVRTPLNHIINYLELALNGPLDNETRDNLNISHAASKNLLFTINDLLDLTRLESGNETSFNDPFDLPATIEEAVQTYRAEALRRQIDFEVRTEQIPKMLLGDSRKVRTVISNLTANAVKFTEKGSIIVNCQTFEEPAGLREDGQVVIEVTVSDTGCGIDSEKLESIFREFEQVEQAASGLKPSGLGLGLAVCARTIEQLGGQLRVDSKPGHGSRFSFLLPFTLPGPNDTGSRINSSASSGNPSSTGSLSNAVTRSSEGSELDDLVQAIASTPGGSSFAGSEERAVDKRTDVNSAQIRARGNRRARRQGQGGEFEVEDSMHPIRSVKIDQFDIDTSPSPSRNASFGGESLASPVSVKTKPPAASSSRVTAPKEKPSPRKPAPPAMPAMPSSLHESALRVLIVEDEAVNRTILKKRLTLDGHDVVTTTNGQEAVDMIESDRAFDCILMDIQMPLKNGFEASEAIRIFEKANPLPLADIRPSTDFNGRIPIFAVSASLREEQRDFMIDRGIDGWILKPIDFKRLRILLSGVTNIAQREQDVYYSGCSWERGGWMAPAVVSNLPPST